MASLPSLFASGRIFDLILVLTVTEGAVLIAWRRRTGRGLAPAGIIGNLLAGVFLLLTLRVALVQGWWDWIALCLAAALLAHVGDMVRRWGA